MYQGKVIQQTLKDDAGQPIRNKKTAREARDRMLSLYAGKREVEVLHSIQGRIDRRREAIEREEDARNPPMAVNRAWKAYQESAERPDSGPSTLSRNHAQFTRFSAWLEREHPGIVLLRDVTEDMAGKYAMDLKAAKLSASTFNQHTGFLKLMWRTLAREIRGGQSPWTNVKRLKVQKAENSRRSITPEQFTEILKNAPDADTHDLIFTLGWTGQRLVDIVMLQWTSVSFKRGVIELIPKKTARRSGHKVAVPLLPPLANLLEHRHRNQKSGLVFPEAARIYRRDPTKVTRTIQDAFQGAGLVPREQRSNLKRQVAVYGAHSLRHYFVTEAMAAGLPSDLVRRITGHTADSMAQHYQHVDAGLLARLAAQLNGTGQAVKESPEAAALISASSEMWRNRVSDIAARLTSKNAAAIRQELMELVETTEGKGNK